MNNNSKWIDGATQLCAEFGPEDGIDPRYLIKNQDRKSGQQNSLRMCSAVTKVLSLVLAGDMNDPILQSIHVVDVTTEGNGQFLRISIGCQTCDSEFNELQVLDALTQVQGYLRSAIAQCINRKRVPALRFQYVGRSGERSCLFKK